MYKVKEGFKNLKLFYIEIINTYCVFWYKTILITVHKVKQLFVLFCCIAFKDLLGFLRCLEAKWAFWLRFSHWFVLLTYCMPLHAFLMKFFEYRNVFISLHLADYLWSEQRLASGWINGQLSWFLSLFHSLVILVLILAQFFSQTLYISLPSISCSWNIRFKRIFFSLYKELRILLPNSPILSF